MHTNQRRGIRHLDRSPPPPVASLFVNIVDGSVGHFGASANHASLPSVHPKAYLTGYSLLPPSSHNTLQLVDVVSVLSDSSCDTQESDVQCDEDSLAPMDWFQEGEEEEGPSVTAAAVGNLCTRKEGVVEEEEGEGEGRREGKLAVGKEGWKERVKERIWKFLDKIFHSPST